MKLLNKNEFNLTALEFEYQNLYECDLPIVEILDFIERKKVDFNPEYQRGVEWSESQQVRFVEWVLRGGNTGKIYFNDTDFRKRGGILEVVDGKQRLYSFVRFLRNEFKVFTDLVDGGVTYSDIQNQISYTVKLRYAVNTISDKNKLIQWFLDLNRGGTYVSDSHIEKVKSLLK